MRSKRRVFAVLTAFVIAALALSACTSSSKGGSGKPVKGGDVTWAEQPGAPPNYIFPLDALQYFATNNIAQFQYLMWRPLYWIGNGTDVALNEQLSLAEPPQYSDGNKVVTMTLKNWKWSDGKPITSRDVTFWINLLRANKENWGEYAPGYFPDDIARIEAPSDHKVVLTLKTAVSPQWFTMSELTQINPVPQHAWDKTAQSGSVGNYDTSTSGAKAVYKFLDGQARDKTKYASDPLWQVVDGPWKLSSFDPSGRAKFVPNPYYSGPVKAKLSSFTEVPFTSGESEYNSLRAGSLTYGYIPQTDVAQKQLVESRGYAVAPWYLWSMNILPINFNNPQVGPMLRQLYVRQALQSLINQKQYVSAILHGYGAVDNGPVPSYPKTPYLTQTLENGAYPYDVNRASQLLTSHGWAVHPNGATTCTKPGTGADECGAGIPAGQKLSFSLTYGSGILEISQEMQAWKSDLSRVGIQLNLAQAPLNEVFAALTPCKPSQSACSWQMGYWGNGWEFAPDYYPSGEVAFSTGAIGNWGSYSDPQMDAKIRATTENAGLADFHTWADYTSQQLPMLFMPLSATQISAISTRLHGATPQPSAGLQMTPESWYLSQ